LPVVFVAIQLRLIISEPTHALPSMNLLLYTANELPFRFCISQGNAATVLRWGEQN